MSDEKERKNTFTVIKKLILLYIQRISTKAFWTAECKLVRCSKRVGVEITLPEPFTYLSLMLNVTAV